MTWDSAVGLASIPFYYMVGVMVSAFLVERPIHRGKQTHYVLVMSIVFLFLLLSAVLGQLGFFGLFGETRLKTEIF